MHLIGSKFFQAMQAKLVGWVTIVTVLPGAPG
jgi:hypothetical protein